MKRILLLILFTLLWSNTSFANNNPILFCKTFSKNGEPEKKYDVDLNISEKYKINENSNLFLRYDYTVNNYFMSATLNRETKVLLIMAFTDSEKMTLDGKMMLECNEEKISTYKRTVSENNNKIAWKVDDKFIIPECFNYILSSGDNYELFYDTYIQKLGYTHWENKDFMKFITETGIYLNKEVPLNHSIITGWSSLPVISLTRQLDVCLSAKPQTFIDYEDEFLGQSSIGYEVIKSLDLEIANELAPNIKDQFESIKQVEITAWGGGSMGPKTHQVVFGILETKGIKILVPLKNIRN
jgi:hypothetical protein